MVDGQATNARSIDLEKIAAGQKIQIDLAPGKYKNLLVFAPATSISDMKPDCELSITSPNKLVLEKKTACKPFDPLWKGERVEVVLAIDGSTAIARLTFTPPAPYEGSPILMAHPPKAGAALGAFSFPASAAVDAKSNCWLFLGNWVRLQCKSREDIDLSTARKAVEEERLSVDGAAVPLYAYVLSGKPVWVKFELKRKAPVPATKSTPPPSRGLSRRLPSGADDDATARATGGFLRTPTMLKAQLLQ